MRDGELQVKFAFTQIILEQAWFGAYVRSPLPPWDGGYLIKVREEGKLEVAEVPNRKPLGTLQNYGRLEVNGDYTFHVEFDDRNLFASLNDDSAPGVEIIDGLKNQSFGNLSVACFGCAVQLKSIETVERDTIDYTES